MMQTRLPIRIAAIGLLAVAAVGSSGCRWFNKAAQVYAMSPEQRPLEVPPDLDAPRTEGAMALPSAPPASVTRSDMQAATPAQSASSFTVPGERDAVYDLVGLAMADIPGLSVVNRAQLLGSYDVDYGASRFLVRVVALEDGAQVSAVDPRGLPATGDDVAKLMAQLKDKLAKR